MSERRHPIETLDLNIERVEVNDNERRERIYIAIRWLEKSIGCGEYSFFKCKEENNGKWNIDSECMDFGEDKDFGRALWKRLLKYKEFEPEEYKEIINKKDEEFLLKLVNEATSREDKELNEELLMKFMDNIKEVY